MSLECILHGSSACILKKKTKIAIQIWVLRITFPIAQITKVGWPTVGKWLWIGGPSVSNQYQLSGGNKW